MTDENKDLLATLTEFAYPALPESQDPREPMTIKTKMMEEITMPRLMGPRATGAHVRSARQRQKRELASLRGATAKHREFMEAAARREEAQYQEIPAAPRYPEIPAPHSPADEDE